MNFILSSKIENLENQLIQLSTNQQQILRSVNDQEIHIQNVMSDIQKQQSWISDIQMEMIQTNAKNGEVIAQFNWQIKEQVIHSKVMFHHALGNKNTFTTIEAKNLGNGLYQAEVPLNLPLEPQWEIFSIVHDQEESKDELKEKREKEFEKQTLNYFVSVTNGENVKSSEVSNGYLGDYGVEKYGAISVNIEITNKSSTVLVTTYQTGLLEKVVLQTYREDQLLEEHPLKPEFEHYILDQITLNDEDRHILKITYKNGASFEKEIY
jgi:hypothetical protein